MYVLYRSYCTAVQYSPYFWSGFVLPSVLWGENTAVFTAYTLLATLGRTVCLSLSSHQHNNTSAHAPSYPHPFAILTSCASMPPQVLASAAPVATLGMPSSPLLNWSQLTRFSSNLRKGLFLNCAYTASVNYVGKKILARRL